MSIAKRLRIFFNSHAEWPLVWSVDDGNQANEQNFEKVYVTVPCSTGYASERQKWPSPSAWMECTGVLEVNGKIALIRDITEGSL